MLSPAEARKAWVAALRSGHFKQTTGILHDNNGYCCLGVACELAADDINITVQVNGSRFEYDEAVSALPDSVREWLGLASEEGEYPGGALTQLNDEEGLSFPEIADFIESHEDELIA